MKLHLTAVVIALSLACFFTTESAHAKPPRGKNPGMEFDSAEERAKKIIAVTPPEELPAMPQVEEPEIDFYASNFPKLPPSRPCEAVDIVGMFKLAAVHEDPPGPEIAGFNMNPVQYILFHPNSLFMRMNVADETMHPKEVFMMMVQHNQNDLQYVIQENGFVYFYQDSVAIDVKVCFVVEKDTSDFRNEQLLLMPPKGQVAGRLVHVYDVIKRPGKKGGRGKGRKRGGIALPPGVELGMSNSSTGPGSAAEEEMRRMIMLKLKQAMARKKRR